MRRWYVAHTQPRAESQAEMHLRRQEFDVYLPRHKKQRRHAGRAEIVAAPLFPGYLFVGIDMERQRWRSIDSTVGVHRLVSGGDGPIPVPPEVIEAIREREDDCGFVVLGRGTTFAKGDRIRVVAGALSDQVGLFDDGSDSQRVVVLLQLLGRPVRVRLPLDAVAACA